MYTKTETQRTNRREKTLKIKTHFVCFEPVVDRRSVCSTIAIDLHFIRLIAVRANFFQAATVLHTHKALFFPLSQLKNLCENILKSPQKQTQEREKTHIIIGKYKNQMCFFSLSFRFVVEKEHLREAKKRRFDNSVYTEYNNEKKVDKVIHNTSNTFIIMWSK